MSTRLTPTDQPRIDEQLTVDPNEYSLEHFTPRIYGAPPHLDGETLSTWLFRTISAKRLTLRMVIPLIGQYLKLASIDFDRRESVIQKIEALLLQRPTVRLAPLASAVASLAPLYRLSLTSHPDGTPLYRYCSQCLADDAIPYIRYHWRLATTVICEKHRLLLSLGCPSCHGRFRLEDYLRSPRHQRWGADSLRYCPKCSSSLYVPTKKFSPTKHLLRFLGFQDYVIDSLPQLHECSRQRSGFTHHHFVQMLLQKPQIAQGSTHFTHSKSLLRVNWGEIFTQDEFASLTYAVHKNGMTMNRFGIE